MKSLRFLIYLLIIGGIITAVVFYFMFGLVDETTTDIQTDATGQSATEEQEQVNSNVLPTLEVITVTATAETISYLETIGTVKSKGQVEVFPLTTATVDRFLIQPGDEVIEGQTIIQLKGPNSASHASQRQLELAEESFELAKASYDNAVRSAKTGEKSAELALESAKNQANAVVYDLQQLDESIVGVKDGINTLQNSLNNTIDKNRRDLAKQREDIDQVIYDINETQSEKRKLLIEIEDLDDDIDDLEDDLDYIDFEDPEYAEIQAELGEKNAELMAAEGQIDGLKKALEGLYTALDNAKYGYQTTVNALKLSENQLVSTLQQSQTQVNTLEIQKQGTATRLGYDGLTTDALQLAQESYRNTLIQLDSSLDQAAGQLAQASINYQIAKANADYLNVRAPSSGIVTELNVDEGDLVSPQSMLTEIVNVKDYQLEVGVDIESAENIIPGTEALVNLTGNKFIKAPVVSVSPTADNQTKLVTVTVKLPTIFFRNNQTMDVRLPVSLGSDSGSLYIPLDAVTIGTQETCVFIEEDGLARKQAVILGDINGELVEITDGLTRNDQIIIGGAKELVDGQQVKVIES